MIDELEWVVGTPLHRDHVDARAGDVPHSQADNAALRALFPAVTPSALADGLGHTVEWMSTAWAPSPSLG